MPLTLRELLDRQRAEREAREGMAQGLMKPETTIGKTFVAEIKTPPEEKNFASGFVRDQYNMPVKDMHVPVPTQPPPKPKLGLFGSLSGGGNANQSTPSVSQETQVGTAQIVQSSASTIGHSNGTQNQAPTPTLTPDETATLRQNLAFLAANLDEAPILGQVLRTTVKQIQDHPELNAVLVDADFDLIVAAARRSMKYAVRKKEDKSDAKTKKQSQKAELEAWLKDSGIDLNF